MDYIANRDVQNKEMLETIGVKSIEELFVAVPEHLRLPPLTEDDGLSEFEGIRWMEALAEKNAFNKYDNYLGAGAYEHHVPSLVGAICGKSEFLTSYTPYQPEVSQGMLQSIFEFQSAICRLTGLDVSNASVYDGASACAEAVLMALRVKKGRTKVVISDTLHPQYKGVVKQYLENQEVAMTSTIDEETACVLVQTPNFFGVIEDVASLAAQAKEAGALTILCANPLVYGLFQSAGELGADIAVGDCQPFGIPLQFGGPYAGYIACREELVRQLPGRIVGETVDAKGQVGYVLTLQAREQHIRREKATSNICTNQALAALASLVAMLWYGKEGIKKLALTNYQRAHYLKDKLMQLPGVKAMEGEVFNEFALTFGRPASEIQELFRRKGIEPGLHLGKFFTQWEDYFLVAVTETKSKEQLDRYVEAAKG